MILGFKPQFKDKIHRLVKIHTIREDKNKRWKAGNSIQFYTGVRTKEMAKFTFDRICISVQTIKIVWYRKGNFNIPTVSVDDIVLSNIDVILLAHNDGFNEVGDFFDWFNKDFEGYIIHWTKLKY